MINNTDNQDNFSQNEADSTNGVRRGMQEKLKDSGKKSFSPLINVLHKYQAEIGPYFTAIAKGLEQGANALNQDSASEADKIVGSSFKEAQNWITEVKSKLEATDVSQLISYLESEAKKRPAFMFSLSYLAGLSLGRVGRYAVKKQSSSDFTADFQTDFSPSEATVSTESTDFSGVENDFNPEKFKH